MARRPAEFAALLLSRFDIVLLDEPTNDLDFDGLERLEDFLQRRGGGLVVVSHDRAFLERIVTSVGEIDAGSHEMTLYRGGWRAYLDARSTAQRHAEEAYAAYTTEHGRLVAESRQQRQWAVTGVSKAARSPRDNDKAQRGFRLKRTEKQASKVRSTERALERLAEAEKPFEPWLLQLEMAAAPRSGDVVAWLEAAIVRRGTWHLGPIDLEIRWGDRLGILGRNGAGKTTLLSAILGNVLLDQGKRWVGPRVVFGELGQVRQRFGANEPLMKGFLSASGLPTREARCRCSPSSPWGQKRSGAASGRSRPASGRGRSWRCSCPKAPTVSCSTNPQTTSISPPSNSSRLRSRPGTAHWCSSAMTAAFSRQSRLPVPSSRR